MLVWVKGWWGHGGFRSGQCGGGVYALCKSLDVVTSYFPAFQECRIREVGKVGLNRWGSPRSWVVVIL